MSVGVSLNPSARACARGYACTGVRQRPCGCGVDVCVCVRGCARIYGRALVRARVSVHACIRVRVRACYAVQSPSIFAHVCAWVWACVCGTTVYVCLGAVRALWWHGGVRFSVIGVRCRARSAAGVTWTSRTLKAEFAARFGHTSVIDAIGAIYVIGGVDGFGAYFQDVWVSTNGGARSDSVGGVGGCTKGVIRGVLRGY